MSDKEPGQSTNEPVEDLWADALKEQGIASESAEPIITASTMKPIELSEPGESSAARPLEALMDVPINISVILGRKRIFIKDLLTMAQGSVIELDQLIGAPMELLTNNYLFARGEIVAVGESFAIRVTEVISQSERIKSLKR